MVKKVLTTKNYRLFERHEGENRILNVKRHKRLFDSMKLYGFLACFPIVVTKDGEKLIVKDGQHRLTIAESLNIEVHYIVEEIDFDVAVVNSTAKIWTVRDYADKFISGGNQEYKEGLDFSITHKIPVSTAFALLAGTSSFGNCQEAFIDGTWKIKDRSWALSVASIFTAFVNLAPCLKSNRFIEAAMAVCRVKNFDASRLIRCAGKRREKLVGYSTRDGYLQMLEDIYNYQAKTLVSLKNEAVMAMRQRNIKINPRLRVATLEEKEETA